jgi:primosomal protein N' (replication factor Y) (superfamily II helicase)
LKYANVILPIFLADTYTYGVPLEMQNELQIGMRVEVQFGSKKIISGIVLRLHNDKPEGYAIKPILSIIDNTAIVTPKHLQFWQWISSYYMATLGEVMQAVLPAFLKLTSETAISKNEWIDTTTIVLSNDEYLIAEALELHATLTLDEVEKLMPAKNARKAISSLIAKQYILSFENIKETYKPKTENVIIISEEYDTEYALNILFESLEKSPKQLHLLLNYLQLHVNNYGVRQSELLDKSGATSAQLKTLIDKNILQTSKQKIDRIQFVISKEYDSFTLNEAQQKAVMQIQESFTINKPVLLHGITGSGKTNVHMQLMKPFVDQGLQVLYLLPEIALTAQIINKIGSFFPDQVAVYHSRFSNNERVETWQNIATGKTKIVIGARSALFLPFVNPGLIIVDEEHDGSYKQQDPAPRYNARDAALVWAKIFGAKIVLSSATPSVESYQNALQNKFALVQLLHRYGSATLPIIDIVDNKQIPTVPRLSPLLSNVLIDKIHQTIKQKKQVILFQNRRGYAPYLYCSGCGWSARCTNCDVGISYHKATDKMHCHYCGTKSSIVKMCPNCNGLKLYFKNYGTERVEDEVRRIFPTATIDRLDTDTANTKNKYQNIIRNVEKNITDILIGTQMVVKGLDFENVQLVGVLMADSLFTSADYRVSERAFQLLSQVSGRAGRKDNKGEVMIQVLDTSNKIVVMVQQNKYLDFLHNEIQFRQDFLYPPYIKLIKITIKNSFLDKVITTADAIAATLVGLPHAKIIGPSEPVVARIKNDYIREVLVKCNNDAKQLQEIKRHITHYIKHILADKKFSNVRIICDVDPNY